MITTLDNSQRVFLIQSLGMGNTTDIFCNLSEIPTVLNSQFAPNEGFIIKHYWNRNFKRCGKKYLNDMFKANGIKFYIH